MKRTLIQKIIFFQDSEYWLVLSVQFSALEPDAAASETAREKRAKGFEQAAEK